MEADDKKDPLRKTPYRKPEIHQVALRPEEAVLGACKTAGSAGPIMGSCSMPVACSSTGS
jgi:hypothetical protein